ncbi:DUF1963 domain-containing protein [Streptomyces sp. NPDC047024]|uniref:DUF1963 domain-containing protein n=1 Tax=Streptomyces sp. NPDC047024 TaxID=3155476 RepID=UPI0033F6942C
MEFTDMAELRRVCAERLGERVGAQYAALARRGFRLEPARGATRCALGGAALLNPDTPWPRLEGVPLSLLAVLDTESLGGAPGLLNFFHLDPDIPYEEYQRLPAWAPQASRVIPADPLRATETPAPTPARRYPARPVRPTEVVMLPDCWDVPDTALEYDPAEHWGAASLLLGTMSDLDGNTSGTHRALGWPDTSYATSVMPPDSLHLLQLAEDADLGWGWGDAGTLYFTIPEKAYAEGDFGAAMAEIRCC